MATDGHPPGSRLDGEIRLVIVDSPDVAAPLVGALDAAAVGGWMWIAADHDLYFSPRVLDILGLDLEPQRDLLSRFLNAVHPADRGPVRDLIECQAPAGPFVVRHRYRHRDGSDHWIEIRGRVERDAAAHLVRQGGVFRDVTADVAAARERAEAAGWFEAVVNAMPFGVWGRDRHLRVSHQNEVAIGWWGDLRGSEIEDVPPDVSRSWRPAVKAALGGRVVRRRQRYELPDGVRVYDETVAPVRVDDEVAGVVGVSIDVTDEQRQREFEAVLAQLANDFVRRPSDQLADAVVTALEHLGRVMAVSIAAVFEISDADRVVVTHWWIDPATGKTKPYLTECDTSVISDLVERLRAIEAIVITNRDQLPADSPGARFLASRRINSLALVPARRTSRGLSVIGVAAMADRIVDWPPDTEKLLRLAGALISSVVERLEEEEERSAMSRRVQEAQKLESLGALAGGVAHDFNNLLTTILGYASLAKTDTGDAALLQESLTQIEAASKRAAEMCRQMLAYAGRGRVAALPVDVTDLVRQSEHLLRVSVPVKIVVQLHLAENLPPVMADATQIQQVLMNLVLNAAEASSADGRVRVETSYGFMREAELSQVLLGDRLPPGDYVRLDVTDWGAGIPVEILPRIFEPFFTTKFTGRGLGLSAVAGIIRAHRGGLLVRTGPNQGSTVSILLPAHRTATSAVASGETPSEETLAAFRATGTALVVDDESGVRHLVGAVLERAGLTVIEADDGNTGVEAFRAHADKLTLIVLDLTMPGLEGREALRAMRDIRPDVPAILMSGYIQGGNVPPGTEMYLQKPFTPAALRAAVWKALR